MAGAAREVNTGASAADGQSVSSDATPAEDPTRRVRDELAAAGADLDAIAFRTEDGAEWTIRDVLDDLEADKDLEDVLDICVKGAA